MRYAIVGNRKGPGRIVETSSGKGRTYNSEPLINGKIPVFISNGQKILCKPENIKCIGFID